mgnify:CR=1 FL=1
MQAQQILDIIQARTQGQPFYFISQVQGLPTNQTEDLFFNYFDAVKAFHKAFHRLPNEGDIQQGRFALVSNKHCDYHDLKATFKRMANRLTQS